MIPLVNSGVILDFKNASIGNLQKHKVQLNCLVKNRGCGCTYWVHANDAPDFLRAYKPWKQLFMRAHGAALKGVCFVSIPTFLTKATRHIHIFWIKATNKIFTFGITAG